jgi:pimeloyl-ACP methyl ester carboxylesterase
MSSTLPAAQAIDLRVGGHRLEAVRFGNLDGRLPVLIFLHEGLGSVSLWRDFPARLCARTGLPGLVYSRAGYGRSDAVDLPRPVDFMHTEARVLDDLRARAGVREAIVIGHSDGGSIALLHAARRPPGLLATVVMAPHLFVEPITLAAIRALRERFADGQLAGRLARHHADARLTFEGWTGIWLDPAFADWTIEAEMDSIDTPLLALQGRQDAYGTMAQLERLAARVPAARWIGLPDCGHSPHLDQPEAVLEAIAGFLRTVVPTARG